ncbi:MAG: tyrosine--tRNA ligase [Lachnospiraceae bacterium]|nr:tyrosine--tRNA ligase [Lachnospiraceae bacterium]
MDLKAETKTETNAGTKAETGDICDGVQQEVNRQMGMILKGVQEVVGEEELRRKVERSVREKKPLVVKLGLDPSAPDIHLGHAVVLRKLRQMQDMGHQIVIIIGDFTGRIGDPTGKTKGRKAMSSDEVLVNALTYQEQIFKVLDREKTEVRYNGEWLELLNFEEVLRLAMTTTVARMLERDDFQKRFQSNIPIGLHEFFYPLMQAYDSVAVQADLELGGTDQTFNILMGRTLQKAMGQEPQAAIFMPILEGLDGVEKMSKSLGNYIGVNEEAQVMFKKVMEVPDALILRYFELATDEPPQRMEQIREELESGQNPRDIKLELARIITTLYHGPEETRRGETFYHEAFSQKAVPSDIPSLYVTPDIPGSPDAEAASVPLQRLFPALVKAGYGESGSRLRGMVSQGGIRLNGEKVSDIRTAVSDGDVLRIGKKQFIMVRFVDPQP